MVDETLFETRGLCNALTSKNTNFYWFDNQGRPKSVVVSETIDAAHQLILQDRHVTYRGIETTLGISGTNIHLILHEHLTVKKICLR